MKYIKYIIFIELLFFQACEGKHLSNRSFIDKHENIDYNIFRERSLIIRSSNDMNLSIIADSLYESRGPVMLIVDKRSHKIIEINRDLKSCKDNTTDESYQKLVDSFLQLNIARISVTRFGNVQMNVNSSNCDNLYYVVNWNDLSNVTPSKLNHIKERWYEM